MDLLHDDQKEGNINQENNKGEDQDSLLDESEIANIAKEDLKEEAILLGVAISSNTIASKLANALNKYIQIIAPNHLDSFLSPLINNSFHS